MRKEIVWFVVLSLLCSAMAYFVVVAESSTLGTRNDLSELSLDNSYDSAGMVINGDPEIEISYPKVGYLHLFQLRPIEMPVSSALGLRSAVVVGRNLDIDTVSQDIHHAKFVMKRMFAGWETVRWDYRSIDGLSMDFGLSSGIYDIVVYAYDEYDNEVGSDSIRVYFLRIGRDDFGVWVNTRYNGGETYSTPVGIGLAEFGSMLNTGESKKFNVTMQHEDDTSVEVCFRRTKIMDASKKVIETRFNIDTDCDTTKEYEVSLELRFPFILLDGGQPSDSNNPYFSVELGYRSFSPVGEGLNNVDTMFYFGRESIEDPRVFRMKVQPDSLEGGSKLTFFNNYLTFDGFGNEVFKRTFSVDFEPATELTITLIPRELKVHYDFGESAGVPTKISFKAGGGLLDDIVQSFRIDPLPSFMLFDLTILGGREFIYECDRSYDVTYSLDSEQNGNLVTFEVVDLPERIHASWGLDLGVFGDLSASCFADLDMSSDVERLALYFFGNEIPFIELEGFPRKLRFDSFVDIPDGEGNITIIRGLDEVREINVSVTFDEMVVTKSFELKNNFVQLSWDIDLLNGIGEVEISRDSESVMMLSTSIIYGDWVFSNVIELKNSYVQLSWEFNREQRIGNIVFSRDSNGGDPAVTMSIIHDGWIISDMLELKNDYIEIFWDLASDDNPHSELGVITSGNEMFYNTLSVVDDSVELLRLGVGVKTDDYFVLSWDNNNGIISNFDWSGRILEISAIDIAINLDGDIFSIYADVNVGESGSLELEFNKAVAVTFLDSESNRFKIHGDVSLYPQSRLNIVWDLGESGEYTIYTYSQPLGDEFNLEFIWDPLHQGNYRYGFRLTGEDFVEITRTIKWFSEDGMLKRIWILGDLPLPGDWELQVLWNYEWYPVPWPL